MRTSLRSAAVLLLLAGAAWAAEAPTPPTHEVVFDAEHGIAPGWMDFGWSPRKSPKGEPTQIDLSGYGGWILAKPRHAPDFAGLLLRYRAPAGFGSFLAVRLESGAERLNEVRIAENEGRELPGGFREVELPLATLDPSHSPFDKLVIRAAREVGHEPVSIERIALIRSMQPAADPYLVQSPSRPVEVVVQCAARPKPINPWIYGVGTGIPKTNQQEVLRSLGTTARRWGGNPTSRYNWRLGNAWNTGSDWFFQNVDYGVPKGYSYINFIDEDRALSIATAITVPTLGWVAKDTKAASFPVADFGPQQRVSPNDPAVGNGVGADGKPLTPGPPQRTSVPSGPRDIEQWVRAIRSADGDRARAVPMYILDNEPGIWNNTHRDVHPDPLTYDELLDKTIKYGAAVRRADPKALIAGPAEWGWSNYLYSGADLAAGIFLRPDRRRHGDKPIIPWLLAKVREHEKRTGVRVLDVLDVHYYPQFKGAGMGAEGDTGPEASARRIRSTRSLWDPDYRDESWIDEKIELLPRLRSWIEENDPGLGISIGEWNFGAEQHMSGGLATAETLGRFGTEGVTSAFYFENPMPGSASFQAFRAFRNYDGKGAHFLDLSVPARLKGTDASAFASRSADGRQLVAVLLNFSPTEGEQVNLALPACGKVEDVRRFGYAGGADGLHELPKTPSPLQLALPPYSITVVELKLAKPN